MQLRPLVGMHKQLYRLLILSVVRATLDYIAHESQIYQLRRQPLSVNHLQALLGRLQARNQGIEPNHFNHMDHQSLLEKIRTDISVAGRHDQDGVQVDQIPHACNVTVPIVVGNAICIHWIEH